MVFPTQMCNTPIVIKVTSGIAESGEPKLVTTWSGNCYYSEVSENVFSKDGVSSTLKSFAVMEGDICPAVKNLEGSVQIGDVTGKSYKIHRGLRPRLPGGEVLYTKLELN